MKKKHRVVKLATKYGTGAPLHTSVTMPHIMVNGDDNGNEHWTPHHLYIISDNEIKELPK